MLCRFMVFDIYIFAGAKHKVFPRNMVRSLAVIDLIA